MALAVAHRDEAGRTVLDAIREIRPPFSPESVVGEFAALLKSYDIAHVVGDRYGGAFAAEVFGKSGIRYEQSAAPKSEIYRDVLSLLNSGKVELLDHPRLAGQLCGLERRTARSGKDSIDHPPGAHDDIANVSFGALLRASQSTASLWSRQALIGSGSGAAWPARADIIFAAVVSDAAGQLAAAYFALGRRNNPELSLLDVDFGPLQSGTLLGIGAKLTALHERVRSTSGRTAIYTSSPVGAELVRCGYNPEVVAAIDRVIAAELLAVECSVHVAGGKVQVCAPVLAKNFPLTFLNGAAALSKSNDALALSVYSGIAVAFGQGRELAA